MKKTRISKKQIWDLAEVLGYTASFAVYSILISKDGEKRFECKSNKEAHAWLKRELYIDYYGSEAAAERYL